MVQRAHAEKALPSAAEIADLDDHRERLQHRNQGRQRQPPQLALEDEEPRRQRAQGHAAGVAHEDRGLGGIVPQKAQQRPHHGLGGG